MQWEKVNETEIEEKKKSMETARKPEEDKRRKHQNLREEM